MGGRVDAYFLFAVRAQYNLGRGNERRKRFFCLFGQGRRAVAHDNRAANGAAVSFSLIVNLNLFFAFGAGDNF